MLKKKNKTAKAKKHQPKNNTGVDEQSLMYLRAKHEWDERIGSAVSSAHSWKLAAFAAFFVAGFSVMGVSYIGAQSKVEPFAVALANDEALPLSPMQSMSDTQLKRVYVANIRSFIENMRSVYVDINAGKGAITKAYAYLRQGDPAHAQITTQFKQKTPFERAETELVKVDVSTVLPLSDNTYQAEWTETLTSPTGQALGVEHFKATLNTYVEPPQTRAAMAVNPLGFFIKTFNDVQVN
ncbi:type IV secretion system protein [Vibrio parahaemolyticus]|nr:type IV secretion system protein [Vibrio parahaemolyticus]